MRIDRKLNLVIPLFDDDGNPFAYVHSTPISAEVYDAYYLPLHKTHAALTVFGLGPIDGPKCCDKLLKQMSKDLRMWDGPSGVEAGLVAEIQRLTNVIAVGKNGWETLPYGVAIQQGILNAADKSEVDAATVFFIVSSVTIHRAQLKDWLEGANSLWSAQLTSLNSTEYMNSLPTATTSANTGATAVT
jgi:hypothetical protein